ncbi:MAG: replication initiator protein A [Pirellulales bacterium]
MEHATPRDSLHTLAPMPFDLEDGRDELNLAEFPLAAIADRVPDNQKTLVFEDKIFDSGKSEMITRRLTISASDKYGLPTSLDDEVILGLIQLTKKNRFTERKVNFSRYQLIQILGWRHEGRSYERLEKSLKRWLGVTLYYDKAWWDKDEQTWVNENFHILEQVTLYDQERRLKRLRSTNAEPPLSSFAWNEVVFRSFKSGYLKAIDFGVFRQLEYAAAKRMYRFLDKRFYHKSRWEFDLTEFACEHIGVSRNYDTGQLKRRLQPAIAELEAVEFLEVLPIAQRYVKISRSQWRIVFVKKAVPQIEPLSQEGALLIKRLADRGVTRSVATELVRDYSTELIETQIEVLDRLCQAKEGESIRNAAGYLVKSIREGYVPRANIFPKRAVPKPCPGTKAELPPQTDPVQDKVNAYLSSLGSEELEEVERTGLENAEQTLIDGYQRSKRTGGPAFRVYRRMVQEREAKRLLLSPTATSKTAA